MNIPDPHEEKGYRWKDFQNLRRIEWWKERQYKKDAKRPLHLPETAHVPHWLVRLTQIAWFVVIIYSLWKIVGHIW